MTQELELQNASMHAGVPALAEFEAWAQAALRATAKHDRTQITVRIVDEAESAQLNQQFRHKQGATNVLSFPFEDPPGVHTQQLGDLVICAPVVSREAAEQGKTEQAHWAHMVVHGILHLCGYDHTNESDADRMEALEIRILEGLGYADPYHA